MANYDWTRFVVRVNIKASAEKLYSCWATGQGMEYWFLRLSEYKSPGGNVRAGNEPVQKGDSYTWRWHGWDDETTEYGQVLDCNGKDFFRFSFGEAGNCTVIIKEEEGQNIAELVQDNIPDTEEGRHLWHLGCKTGWTFYLTNLKSLLEGGPDLRNKNVNLKRVITS